MEFGKGRVSADDVLRGGHPPGEVVGVPRDWHGRGDGVAIVVVHLGDLGDVALLEEALNVDGMAF